MKITTLLSLAIALSAANLAQAADAPSIKCSTTTQGDQGSVVIIIKDVVKMDVSCQYQLSTRASSQTVTLNGQTLQDSADLLIGTQTSGEMAYNVEGKDNRDLSIQIIRANGAAKEGQGTLELRQTNGAMTRKEIKCVFNG